MAKNDYHVIVYYLLSYLYDCLKRGRPLDRNVIRLEAYPEEIDPGYYRYILDHLLKDGLIEGVSIHEVPILGQRNASQLRGLDDMRITPAGITYLQENFMMKKAANLAKGIADII